FAFDLLRQAVEQRMIGALQLGAVGQGDEALRPPHARRYPQALGAEGRGERGADQLHRMAAPDQGGRLPEGRASVEIRAGEGIGSGAHSEKSKSKRSPTSAPAARTFVFSLPTNVPRSPSAVTARCSMR